MYAQVFETNVPTTAGLAGGDELDASFSFTVLRRFPYTDFSDHNLILLPNCLSLHWHQTQLIRTSLSSTIIWMNVERPKCRMLRANGCTVRPNVRKL